MDREINRISEFHSASCIRRHPANPILTPKNVPYPCLLAFNAGVTKYQGRYVMAFRNDYGDEKTKTLTGTNIGLAFSNDGIQWDIRPNPCFHLADDEIRRAYDPRLTVIDGRCYMCFAVDTYHGIRGGIAVTEDFDRFTILSMTLPCNRNLVLFPDKIGKNFIRLERPFPFRKNRDLWCSESPDLKFWGNHQLVLGNEKVLFCNEKIGPAAPPVKTPEGWLTLFHAVDFDASRGKNGWEDKWQKRYTVGLMLLDLENPAKIIARCEDPIMIPKASYEVAGGFRNNVIFPGGMILEDDGEVKMYYGAADAVECLATADLADLLKLLE